MMAPRFQTRGGGGGHQTDLASLWRKGRGGRGVVSLEEMEGQHGKFIHHHASLPPHFTESEFLFHTSTHTISLSHICSHSFSLTQPHTLFLFHTYTHIISLSHSHLHNSLSHIHTISLTCTLFLFHTSTRSLSHIHTISLSHIQTFFRCVHVHTSMHRISMLPICLLSLNLGKTARTIIGGSCHKYHFCVCCDKMCLLL